MSSSNVVAMSSTISKEVEVVAKATRRRLPAASIDHLGLSKEGFPKLLRLAEKGVRVKATGFGRVDFPVSDALRAIHSANPHALMFGTDLPLTRAPRPFETSDIDLLVETLGDKAAEIALWQNAVTFYRISVNAV
jgi:hypothetical protein